ncbi:MAG: 3'(2'),5'-bisphosphate nucleotidase CysQ [Chromatiales bacterium]|jgi:3'(2'), 5'-bisphosphate nucleotidase|nr:3'(2'),5'-bisphosphate nucleotidase CysQ [Chromatiales bacterium]
MKNASNAEKQLDVGALLQPVITLARRASKEIVRIYDAGFHVEHKEDKSPLTEADMVSHEIIERGLTELTPDLPVLSEESAAIPFAERARWQCYWLVDPLDGTREFVKRNGEFTVNIALIENHVPVLGVIVVPVTQQCYYAARGAGAWREANGEAPVRIHVRAPNPAHLVIAGSRSHAGDRLMAFLDRIGSHELISMGSSLKSCLVAEGRADVYPRLGPTSEWDTAAAHCIVDEAGGRMTDTAMRPLRYNTKESLLNPDFFVSGDPQRDWSRYLGGAGKE